MRWCTDKFTESTTTPEAALECLRNIPFSKTEALDLIDNMRIFTHFVPSQAYYTTDTLPWLELPVFNVNKSIGEIEERAKSGYYKNGYDFWHAIELVYTNFRDGHMAFRPTCGGFAFLYFHEHGIVSVGTESGGDREIWTVEESKNSTVPKLLKQIAKINGLAAVDYLLDLANYLPELTYLDPDTRWNALMSEWPSGRTSNRFRSRSYWRGAEAEKLVLEYADGTKLNIKWKANFQRSKFPEFDSTDSLVKKICYASDKYVALWAPSASAEEVKKNPRGAKYKELKSATQLSYIKLQTDEQEDATGSKGISEEDATKSKDISEEDATAASGAFTPRTTPLYGYPEPEDRGPNDALVWYLDPDDETVAILHIPTFGVTDIDPWESFFHSTLEGLHSNGIKKLIVDVSGNGGGNAILGKRSTRMFFPEDFNGEGEPDQYAQLRYHPALSKIMRGEVDDKFAKEDFFDEDKFSSLKNENMTLDELLGPYTNKRVNDYFTAMSLYKRDIVTAEDFTNYFDHKNYWKKEDVIIVTNSRCSSTCHNFVELMGQVGVRSFAFGGRPGYEAMQSVGGTKG